MADAKDRGGADDRQAAPETTRDAFYDGRLILSQPAKGHRSGTDAVLLAAAVPADFSGSCYDMGAGVGAVGLGVALMHSGAIVTLVERDEAMSALARANAAGSAGRVDTVTVNILNKPSLRRALPRRAALIVTNPPFRAAADGRLSPDPLRRSAHAFEDGAGLGAWLAACLDRLADKGRLIVVHAASALPELLGGLAAGAGAITVKPIQPRSAQPAHRVLVRAIKGSRAPFSLAAPLILHAPDGSFTDDARRLHEGREVLSW